MINLNNKTDVIEWYWPDFLAYCMRDRAHQKATNGWSDNIKPTVDNFWQWYITSGPMGLKNESKYYTKSEVQYV